MVKDSWVLSVNELIRINDFHWKGEEEIFASAARHAARQGPALCSEVSAGVSCSRHAARPAGSNQAHPSPPSFTQAAEHLPKTDSWNVFNTSAAKSLPVRHHKAFTAILVPIVNMFLLSAGNISGPVQLNCFFCFLFVCFDTCFVFASMKISANLSQNLLIVCLFVYLILAVSV